MAYLQNNSAFIPNSLTRYLPHSKPTWLKLTANWPNDLEIPKVVHNVQFTMTNVQSVLLIGQSVVEFIEVFRSMTNCRICRRIVMEHWPNTNEKRCTWYVLVDNMLESNPVVRNISEIHLRLHKLRCIPILTLHIQHGSHSPPPAASL